jgi:ABC-type multidrug transport system fused ATPase/permease subunit
MQARKRVWTRKRPIAVTIVAWGIVVLFLVRLFQVFEPLIRMDVFGHGFQLTGPLTRGMILTPLGQTVLTSAVYLVLSVAGVIVLIGFLRLRQWAWVMLMAWTGFSLAISLFNYFYTHANYLVMASNTIIALALNQAEVRGIFRIRTTDVEPIAQPDS